MHKYLYMIVDVRENYIENLFHWFSEIEAMQWPMLQKGFSQTSQGAKLAANNLFLAANSCKQIVYLLLKVFKRFSNYITKYMPNCLIWSDINVTTSCLKFLYCVQIEKCYMSSSLLQLSCLSFTPTHSFCLSPAPMAGTEHQTTSGLRGTQGEVAPPTLFWLLSHSLNFLHMYWQYCKVAN